MIYPYCPKHKMGSKRATNEFPKHCQALQLILRDFYRAMGQDGAAGSPMTGTSSTFAWVGKKGYDEHI